MTSKTEPHTSQWSNYEASLTTAMNATDKIPYVGPRAIFDPNFVPPVFFPQKSQSMLLQGIIQDALEDEYPTNVNLYGLKGTGKNLLVNHFLQWYQKTTPPFDNRKQDVVVSATDSICILHVDCTQREMGQIFFSLISQISHHLHLSLQLEDAIGQNPATMWNTLKFLIHKVTGPILLYLHQSENLGAEILSKFFVFAKSTQNLQIITTINTGLQQYSFKQYERMDHKVKMDNFTCRDLRDITRTRSSMVFKNQLESEVIDMIVNYISEFDLQVPGACINYLKEVYPIIGQQHGVLSSENLRDISQYYFEGFTVDALTMADFVISTSLEDRLFLDYIVNYFRNPDHFFIPFHEIRNAYSMSCEEMGFQFEKTEFFRSFAKISDAQIVRPNALAIQQGAVKKNGVYPVDHFLTLPMEEVSDILNFSFGQGVGGIKLNQLRLN